jgi:hypothetical protein
MHPIVKNGLALLAGLFSAVVVISAVQACNFALYPPPPALDYNDPAQLALIMAQMPFGALVVLELSYALGSLAGGAVLGWLAASAHRSLALALGGMLTLAGLANLMTVPHPLWISILTTVTYVPMAWLGVRLRPRAGSGLTPRARGDGSHDQ